MSITLSIPPGAQQFLEFAKEHQVKVPKGWKWSREEATERKMRCLA